MKAQQIEKLLAGVINKFIDEIGLNAVRIAISNRYVTGGCIPSMLMGEWVNDYDVYIRSKEDVDIVKDYFNTKYTGKKFTTDNAITLYDHKIQIITGYYGNASEMTEKFDWAHIKSWYNISDGKLTLCNDLYRLLMEKELIYTGSEYPLSSLLRTRKFLKKGWHISTVNMTHIALDICKVFQTVPNINDYEIEEVFENPRSFMSEEDYKIPIDRLIDQLNGVDPLTIQQELIRHTGQWMSISEIIKIMNV